MALSQSLVTGQELGSIKVFLFIEEIYSVLTKMYVKSSVHLSI